MRSKKPTLFQQAIKEIKRLEKAARRVEKRGYKFDLPFRKTKTGKEKTKYTKSEVEKLKNLKTKDLYKYSTYNGKSGVERRKEERKEAAQKGAQTKYEKRLNKFKKEIEDALKNKNEEEEYYRWRPDLAPSINRTIIDNFLNRDNWRFLKDNTYQKLLDFINSKINELGDASVAQAIQDATNTGFVSQFQLSYDYQFTINLMMFEDYFGSTGNLDDIKNDEYDNNFTDYNGDDDFDDFFG